jgi:hypothetical protein
MKPIAEGVAMYKQFLSGQLHVPVTLQKKLQGGKKISAALSVGCFQWAQQGDHIVTRFFSISYVQKNRIGL